MALLVGTGCATDDIIDDSNGGLRRGDDVTADGGAACETDADCAGGEECEIEHGFGYCKAHGGDETGADDHGGSGGGSDDDPAGDDKGGSGNDDTAGDDNGDDGAAGTGPCASDADCGAGEECELEHGAGFCKAHGGD